MPRKRVKSKKRQQSPTTSTKSSAFVIKQQTKKRNANDDKYFYEKITLLIVVAFDMFAVGLIVPLLTPFQRELGATPSQIGFLSSLYGAVQILSSPILGYLSDRVSRREVLVICITIGAIGYGLLGIATSLYFIFASRLIVGIARQTQTITKAWLSDMTTKETQMRDLSWYSATVSLGFMFGPSVGGKLAKRYDSMRVPFSIAFMLFLCNAFLIRISLPKELKEKEDIASIAKKKRKDKKGKTMKQQEEEDRKSLCQQFASLQPNLQRLMLIRFLLAAGIIFGRNNIFNLLEYRQALDVEEKGQLISFFGIISVVSQIFIIGPIVKSCHFQPKYLLSICSFMTSIGFVGLAYAPTKYVFMSFLALIAIFSSANRVSMSALLTQAAGKDAYGEVLGVSGSVSSICRAIAPLLSGLMIDWYGSAVTPTLLASFCCLLVTIFGPLLIVDEIHDNKNLVMVEKKVKKK